MKRTTYILNILYCLIIILFLLDGLTQFDIKSQWLKSCIYSGLLVGTLLMVFWNLLAVKKNIPTIIRAIYPVIILIFVIIVNPIKIVFASSAWQTQTIIYQNSHLRFKKVEYQRQDVGASGYNNRTVEVIYLTPLFMIVNDVPDNIDQRTEWVSVNIEVNELGIKYP